MKKSYLLTGFIYIVAGLGFLILALTTDTRLNSVFSGLAGAGIGPGLMMIYKYFYWNRPENKQRYQKKLENEQIEIHDELKSMLRAQAGRWTYVIGTLAISLAMLVFCILGQLEIVADYKLIIFFLFGFMIFQFVIYIAVFNHLLKKF